MSQPSNTASASVTWAGNRNIIVPPDIIPVRRVSPLPFRKRTPLRPRPDGEPVQRSGGREWFGDQLFADAQTRDLRAACGSSIGVHASCFVALLLLLSAQPQPSLPQRVSAPLRMPVFVAVLDGGTAGRAPGLHRVAPLAGAVRARRVSDRSVSPPAATRRVVEARRPLAAPVQSPPAVAAARAVEMLPDDAHRVDAPRGIAERARDADANTADAGAPGDRVGSGERSAGGAAGSGANGYQDGIGQHGVGGSGAGHGAGGRRAGVAMSPGPYRLGQGIDPPRKIKDVRPVYPPDAMALRALGTVVIEAIVGADGKVHEATVIHSIPALDQAALEAVRQWEFLPSRLNGVAVAVVVTILVQFTLH